MFGTIIIVLPSAYEGASLHFTHSGKSKTFDCAATSKIATSVLAWYSDVHHSVDPVTSGYRLALSYNLIQPPSKTTKVPKAPQVTDATENLRHVLLSWKVSDGLKGAPQKLAYILEHEYSLIGMTARTLKGKDAPLVSFVRSVAQELGFELYLANLKLTESGNDEEFHFGGYYGEDDGDGVMGEVYDTELEVVNAVDLDGNRASLNLDIDQEEEMIPGPLNEIMGPTGSHREGYTGNVSDIKDLVSHPKPSRLI